MGESVKSGVLRKPKQQWKAFVILVPFSNNGNKIYSPGFGPSYHAPIIEYRTSSVRPQRRNFVWRKSFGFLGLSDDLKTEVGSFFRHTGSGGPTDISLTVGAWVTGLGSTSFYLWRALMTSHRNQGIQKGFKDTL